MEKVCQNHSFFVFVELPFCKASYWAFSQLNEALTKERRRVVTHGESDAEEAKEGTCRLGGEIRTEWDLLSKTAAQPLSRSSHHQLAHRSSVFPTLSVRPTVCPVRSKKSTLNII